MGKAKYTDDFRRDAVELVKKLGVTKASKELKLAHCTLSRWCREMNDGQTVEEDTQEITDIDAAVENYIEEQLPSSSDEEEAEETTTDESADDTIATAMALLVIENQHLREIIRSMRETLSGMTDHQLI